MLLDPCSSLWILLWSTTRTCVAGLFICFVFFYRSEVRDCHEGHGDLLASPHGSDSVAVVDLCSPRASLQTRVVRVGWGCREFCVICLLLTRSLALTVFLKRLLAPRNMRRMLAFLFSLVRDTLHMEQWPAETVDRRCGTAEVRQKDTHTQR